MKKPDLKLPLAELARAGWKTSAKKIVKNYEFKGFEDAFAFMTRCALDIEKVDHHPEWLNVYNKVNVELSTHSAGGVTMKDVQLAKIMDKIAKQFSAKSK
ncbi:MAG TPA: 4a-hydroxytetrahydrobiopterin dehydratase [Alphaproteobacteria bacterium]|nr:4a-hydroxytetrahydrobiopterin dehydratase [Alphaproteobacteria bacterium]